MLQVFGSLRLKTLTFVTGLAVATGLLTGLALFGVSRTGAASCTNNDIIKCGVSSPGQFIGRVQVNDNGVNGMQDLQAVYAFYGLTSADYANFSAHAAQGEATRDGRIVVSGRVVATDARSIGRVKTAQGTNPFTVTISGQTYYGNANSQVFAAGVQTVPVYVLLNADGTMKFAVIPNCGNPEYGTVTAAPPASPPVQALVPSAPSAATQPVVQQMPPPSVTVTPPASVPSAISNSEFAEDGNVVCKNLDIQPTPDAPQGTYTLTATSQKIAAIVTQVTFFFGDGSLIGVPPNGDGTTATTQHVYTTAGILNTNVSFNYVNIKGELNTSLPCTVKFSPLVAVGVQTISPGGSQLTSTGSPAATTTPASTAAPSTTSTTTVPAPAATTTATTPVAGTTTTPAQLPNTGARDTIGVFFMAVAAGALGFRFYARRKLGRPTE